MNPHGLGGSIRAAVATTHAQVELCESVDDEDVRVYLPARDDDAWIEHQFARHYAEAVAQEGLNDVH